MFKHFNTIFILITNVPKLNDTHNKESQILCSYYILIVIQIFSLSHDLDFWPFSLRREY